MSDDKRCGRSALRRGHYNNVLSLRKPGYRERDIIVSTGEQELNCSYANTFPIVDSKIRGQRMSSQYFCRCDSRSRVWYDALEDERRAIAQKRTKELCAAGCGADSDHARITGNFRSLAHAQIVRYDRRHGVRR